jgi:hypothetical protein
MKNKDEGSPLTTVSLRMDRHELTKFETIIDAAGLFNAEAIRHLVVRAISDYEKADMDGFHVAAEFKRKPASNTRFSELLGNLSLTVSPPEGMSAEQLHRLIFILPEFIDEENSRELYRVDNAHFHRVVENTKHIASKKRSRAVLSFRLIKGRWSGSLFDYSGDTDTGEIVEAVVRKMEDCIAATIRCELAGQLPTSRHLTADEVAERDELLMSYLVADYPS